MLKTTVSSQVLFANRVLVINKVLAANEINNVEGSDESIKKYRKLSKTRKSSKSWKLSKSQKLAKSRKESLKSGNLPNFDIKENGPSFLTPDIKTAFNHLWLAFTKALILWHFDLECHIWIEINALDYAIGDVLS